MIVGNDISNFQGNVDFNIYAKNSNFLIAKATEGTGFIDGWYGNNRAQARFHNLPFGSYAFARPDTGNSPEAEAEFFCKVIDGDPIIEGEVLALDYEVNYHDPVNWCLAWLIWVRNHYNGNISPLIYLNQSTAKNYDWSPVVNAGFGLWIAAYTYDPNNNNAQIGKWPFAAMQQWTDKQPVPGIAGVVDGDVFFGDINAFKAYGYHKKVSPSSSTSPSVSPSSSKSPSKSPSSSISSSISSSPSPSNEVPTDPLASCLAKETAAKTILYGSGFWWIKLNNLKKVFPK